MADDIFFYNLDYIKNQSGKNEIQKFIKNYHRVKPLEVLCVENGTILPQKEADKQVYPNTWMGLGGVLDATGNFVKMSGIKAIYADDFVFGGKYDYTELEEYNETILYMGAFQPQWGHFLIEYCTRLWYSVKSGNKYKIAYCGFACEQGEMPKAFRDFLRLLGINKEMLVDIRRPTKYARILIPEQSFLRNQYYTEEYKFIIDTIYNNLSVKNLVPYDKIYFSRNLYIKNTNTTKELGEQEIQDTFQKNGYKILAPETLSVEEQIFYVRNCKEFVAILGSTSDNAVFAGKETKKVYLRKAFEVIPETFQIEQMTDAQSVTFIDCYYEPYKDFPKSYGGGPHFIGTTKELKLFFKKNNMELLSANIYMRALLNTWTWLSKMEIRERIVQSREKRIIHKMKLLINNSLKNKKIIVYPCGKWGSIAKEILDEEGITTYILVDHYKSLRDKRFYDLNVLKDEKYLDYVIFLCCDNRSDHYKTIKTTAYHLVHDTRRIVSVFK